MLAWLPLAPLLALPLLAASLPPLGPGEVALVKSGVALAGTLLLGLRALVPGWEHRPQRWRRAWDVALLGLGVLGAACWWNLFQFNFPSFGHPSETYHYYIGSKYFDELGYTRLYRCTAVADAEAGLGSQVQRRYARNLETNTVEPAAGLLRDPELCKRHFTPERWRDFRRDVGWFRRQVPQRRWHASQTDHGYNGTPTWGSFGSLLASTGPASDGRILALRLVDPLLLLLGFGFVGATFGWRVLCVALLYWGTSYPSQYSWVGGSYLRQLELASVLVGICLMRRQRMLAAGYLLTLAALVRIYPALLLAGPALAAVADAIRERRPWLSPGRRRLLLGGLLAAATLLPLAAATSGGLGSWRAFAENSRVLLGTPLRNHLGLRTLLSYDHATRAQLATDPSLDDPYAPWKQGRQEAFERRRAAFAALLAGFLVLLAAAARSQPDWVGVVLAAGLVPVAGELTCYYSAILVVYALLWERHPPVGAGLVALSALGWMLAGRFLFYDQIFTWISLAMVGFVLFATVWVWRAPERREDGGDTAFPRGS